MYPTSTIVTAVIADRRREAETAHAARVAARVRGAPSWRSRPVPAALTRLTVLAAAGRGDEANEHARP